VDGAALHPQSAAMISQLVSLGGFGLGRLQVDFSIVVLEASAGGPQAPFVPSPGSYTPDYYYGKINGLRGVRIYKLSLRFSF